MRLVVLGMLVVVSSLMPFTRHELKAAAPPALVTDNLVILGRHGLAGARTRTCLGIAVAQKVVLTAAHCSGIKFAWLGNDLASAWETEIDPPPTVHSTLDIKEYYLLPQITSPITTLVGGVGLLARGVEGYVPVYREALNGWTSIRMKVVSITPTGFVVTVVNPEDRVCLRDSGVPFFVTEAGVDKVAGMLSKPATPARAAGEYCSTSLLFTRAEILHHWIKSNFAPMSK